MNVKKVVLVLERVTDAKKGPHKKGAIVIRNLPDDADMLVWGDALDKHGDLGFADKLRALRAKQASGNHTYCYHTLGCNWVCENGNGVE